MAKYKLPIKYDSAHWSVRRDVRNQYVEEQNNLCHFCKCDLNGQPSVDVLNKVVNPKRFPKMFFDHPIHLHHSRVTGLTIGAVHAKCNAVLWQYYGQ